MAFVFTCPHCDFESRIASHFEGETGPCVNCGKPVTVVRPAVETDENREERSNNATGLAMLLLLAGVVFFVSVGSLIYVVVVPQAAQRRIDTVHQRTRQRLEKIGQALQAYAETHGSYPPAFTTDAAGKPMHSWRVLILPQLGYPELYSRYDFTDAWNGPTNQFLMYEMPVEYASATDETAINNNESSFYVITGKGSPFPKDQTVRVDQIRDEKSETVLVAETRAFGFSWLEPRDIALSELELQINATPGKSFSSASPMGPQVLTANGEVRTLRFDAPAEALPAMATIDGGEPINWKAVATD